METTEDQVLVNCAQSRATSGCGNEKGDDRIEGTTKARNEDMKKSKIRRTIGRLGREPF